MAETQTPRPPTSPNACAFTPLLVLKHSNQQAFRLCGRWREMATIWQLAARWAIRPSLLEAFACLGMVQQTQAWTTANRIHGAQAAIRFFRGCIAPAPFWLGRTQDLASRLWSACAPCKSLVLGVLRRGHALVPVVVSDNGLPVALLHAPANAQRVSLPRLHFAHYVTELTRAWVVTSQGISLCEFNLPDACVKEKGRQTNVPWELAMRHANFWMGGLACLSSPLASRRARGCCIFRVVVSAALTAPRAARAIVTREWSRPLPAKDGRQWQLCPTCQQALAVQQAQEQSSSAPPLPATP